MAHVCRKFSHSRGASWLLRTPLTTPATKPTHIHLLLARPNIADGQRHFTATTAIMKDSSSWTDVTPTIGSRDRRSSSRSSSRMSAAGGDDPFDKLDRGNDRNDRNDRDRDYSRDKDRNRSSGKFGRSSFPLRESSSRDRFDPFSSPSMRSPRSYNSDSGNRDNAHRGGGGRSYDPSITDRRGGPSQNMASEHDYLYSPNVIIPALNNGFRTPYKLYYSNTLIQNRKK
ncbi:MAG: hypothetical protein JOS17DRAFT_441999 [Linnemannia elongata]|nr:MAG: hypothetical protein JOS17DRAFT_441999 [Linnemannia elongata]